MAAPQNADWQASSSDTGELDVNLTTGHQGQSGLWFQSRYAVRNSGAWTSGPVSTANGESGASGLPSGTIYDVQIRWGGTASPDENWSDWSATQNTTTQ